jgi:hypothetical protein
MYIFPLLIKIYLLKIILSIEKSFLLTIYICKIIISYKENVDMKKNIKNTINEMKKMATSLSKTINEGLTFEGDDIEFDEPEVNEPEQGAMEQQVAPQEESGLNVEAFVDDIRKKALKGMAQLAENPEDPRYQILKKIWQICDKKPEDQQNQNKPM